MKLMMTHESKLRIAKWSIRIGISLAVLFVALVLFASTVLIAKYLISVKEAADRAEIQSSQNAKAIDAHASDIEDLKTVELSSPTPSPTATPIAKRHATKHPSRTPRPWWKRWFE